MCIHVFDAISPEIMNSRSRQSHDGWNMPRSVKFACTMCIYNTAVSIKCHFYLTMPRWMKLEYSFKLGKHVYDTQIISVLIIILFRRFWLDHILTSMADICINMIFTNILWNCLYKTSMEIVLYRLFKIFSLFSYTNILFVDCKHKQLLKYLLIFNQFKSFGFTITLHKLL